MEANIKNWNSKVSAKLNSAPIQKIYSENIEKCRSLRLFGEIAFAIITKLDLGDFVNFWRFFALNFNIHISTNIILSYIYMKVNMYFSLSFHAKSILFKNIDS